jgi:hypothetical protein
MNGWILRKCCGVLAALAVVACAAISSSTPVRAQDSEADTRQRQLDSILDLYVRDGYVYYRALKSDRAKLDAYVASLDRVRLDIASPQEQVAFWINGYNALVLQTVINQYPIPARTREYPAGSIRQIPGAFERQPHRLAGRTLTLDQIEQTVLPTFHDPRVFLALGRGAVASGRLRSEAYDARQLETQLIEAASECAARAQCVHVDNVQNVLSVNAIFSWRRNEFVDAYAERAAHLFEGRSPVERAILALISPKMLAAERDMLEKNNFRMEYQPFDWALNDLTGRGDR